MEAPNRQFGKELVDSVAKQFGYELDAVQVRDLMIVGDLKRVFTRVMSAKQAAITSSSWDRLTP
jgi:regulator of protease activity HflC (stomatin/prohibitin superfamily)